MSKPFTTRAFLVAYAVLAIGFCLPATAQKLKNPTARDRTVGKLIADLMQTQHLSKRKFDDETAKRGFDLYIKRMDPIKVYFTQADIAEFRKKSLNLDNELLRGEYATAFEIFKRFLQRVDERVKVAHELIDAEHDFTVDENMETDPDNYDFPKGASDARDRWRKRIKYNLLLERNKSKSEKEKANDRRKPKKRLKDRYTAFSKRMHQYNNEDVVELFVSSMTGGFDPHTSFMSRATYENFLINFGLQLEGIGATLQSTDDGLTQIKRVVKGGPLAKHGKVKVDDKIVAVGQAEGDMVDITWMKLDDVVKMIRGKKGTVVRLSVLKPNDNEIKTYTITRDRVELKDQAAQGKIFEAGKKSDGSKFKIGVIELPSFYAGMKSEVDGQEVSTTRDLRRILENFNEKNVDSLVLDLRANGGGSLLEAINATGLFIDRGPVVQVKDPFGRIEVYDDTRRGTAWNKPMVVLTSKFSASASEILAGAIQDYDRGIVVGDTATHGKGTVQNLVNLARIIYRTRDAPNDFGALKITLQQFYRPNGDSTQKRGVLSDIVLPSMTDHMDVAESDLDHTVEFDKVTPANYTKVGKVNKQWIAEIRKKSAERVKNSKRFLKELRRIKLYKDQKESKVVSLNEEKFKNRRKEFSAEEEDKKAIEDQVNNNSDEIKRDYYLDEVFEITRDYFNLLQKADKNKNARK